MQVFDMVFYPSVSNGLFLEGHPKQLQQAAAFVVRVGRGDDGHFHATYLVDGIEGDFREDQLFAEANGVVATPIELGRHTAKVTNTRQRHVNQAIQKRPHFFATQRHLDADGLALTEFKSRDSFARFGNDRLLPSDRFEGFNGKIEGFRIINRLADANVTVIFLTAGTCITFLY
jgi:hypothetical protein